MSWSELFRNLALMVLAIAVILTVSAVVKVKVVLWLERRDSER